MAPQRLLIFGFSNVATKSGFTQPTIDRLAEAAPEIDVRRLGLGALQPQVVPPYLRIAGERMGPFSHVLLEINASAFAMHPLSTEARGREYLADMVMAVHEMGATPIFMLHYRRWNRPVVLDFDDLVRRFCAELDLPLIDLAAGFVARHGQATVEGWLRDDVHTTAEGGAVMAEALAPFLLEQMDRPRPAPRSLPRPEFRRASLDPSLPGRPRDSFDISDMALDFTRLDSGENEVIALDEPLFAQGLVHLFHPAGGRAPVTLSAPGQPEAPLTLATIDPHSYVPRIGVLAFDFYRGLPVDRLTIGPTAPADDITLIKGERGAPLRSYIGPILTLEPL